MSESVADTSSPGLARSPGYERPAQNASGEARKFADEKAFASLLTDTVVESMADILGENVLSLLISKGMLDHAENPGELERQLSLTFGNGSVVLERMIVKALYRKLGYVPIQPSASTMLKPWTRRGTSSARGANESHRTNHPGLA